MSRVIEEEVVKMQFDNKGFETKVKESMSTLDKLKAALHFKDVDMSPLEKAFQKSEATATQAGFHIRDVWLKMSEVFEYQIARKIVNAGEKIAKSLTIEGAMDGFKEYELKMGSIQTIMAGTGESLATVNHYLDELNTYSDKTIYSFKDMTDNIGKFTNAGVELDDAVNAIKGIANEAAVSGANANEASRAMYNFSQALSAGYVKLIDWKSIENANMATVEFKDTLLQVAEGIGTVKKNSDGMYDSLTVNAQGKAAEAFNSMRNFNDSLQAQWMNTEVLTTALKIYATDIRELSAVEKEAYESELQQLGMTDEQIAKFEELGIKAANSATEIKTFSMMMDTLKEAIGSGWAMTWQYIIGDFEQAKELWTSVGGTIGGVIDKISEARNTVLQEGLATGWEDVVNYEDQAIPAAETLRERLTMAAVAQGKLTEEEAKNLEKTSDWVKSVREKGWVTEEFLKESLNDYYDYLNGLDKESREALGVDDAALTKFGLLITKINLGAGSLKKLTKGLTELGGRENIIEGLRIIFTKISSILGKIGEAWNHVFNPITGDTVYNLTQRFKNFAEALTINEQALESFKVTFTVLFQALKTGFNVISSVVKGVTKLVLPLLNLLDAIIGVFGQLVSAITGSSGVIDLTDKLSSGANALKEGYLKVMQWIADKINEIADALRNWKESKAFQTLSKWVNNAKNKLSEFWDEFTQLPVIIEIMDDFEKVSNKVSEAFARLGEHLSSFFSQFSSRFTMENFGNVLQKIYTKLKDFGRAIITAKDNIVNFFREIKAGKTVTESFRDNFKGIIDKVKELKTTIKDFFDKVFSSGDGSKFDQLKESIHEFFSTLDADKVTAIALTAVFGLFAINLLRLTNAVSDTVAAIGSTFNTLKTVINSYMKRQKSILLQIAEAIVIVAAALYVLSTIPKDKMKTALTALYAISGCIAVLVVIMGVITKISNAGLASTAKLSKLSEMTFSLVGLAGTIVLATFALKKIAELNLGEGIIKKIGIVVGAVGAMAVIAGVLSKIKVSDGGIAKTTITLLAIAASLYLVTEAMIKIAAISKSEDELNTITNTMIKMMAGLALVAFAAGNITGFSALGILAVVFLFEKLMPRIEEIVNYDYTKINEGLEKNKAVIDQIGLMVGAMVIIGGIFGKGFGKFGGGLIKLIAAMALMVIVTKKASELSTAGISRGTKFMKALTDMLTELVVAMAVYNLASKLGKDQKGGGFGLGTFLGIALALGVMALIAKKAGSLNPTEMKQGLKFISVLTLLIDAMFIVAGIAGKGDGASFKNLALMLGGISFILGLMVTLSIIKDKDGLYTAMAAIAVVILSLSMLFKSVSKITSESEKTSKGVKKSGSSSGTIFAVLAGVAAIIGGMVWLSKQPVNNIVASAAGITVAMLAYAVVFKAVQKNYGVANATNKKRIATIISALLGVAVVAGAIIAISKKGGDAKNVASAAAGLTVGLLGFAVCIKALGHISGTVKKDMKYKQLVASLGGAIGALIVVGTAIGFLSHIGGEPGKMIASATAITIGLVGVAICAAAMGYAMKICEEKNLRTSLPIVLGAIGAMAAVATAIGIVANTSASGEKLKETAIAIGIGTLAVALAAVLISTAGRITKASDMVNLAIIILGAILAVAVIAGCLKDLVKSLSPEELDKLIEVLPMFSVSMVAFGVMALALGAAGRLLGTANIPALIVIVLVALVGLALLVAEMIGLGAILNNFEGRAKKNLETGLDALVEICGKVGTACGQLIGNFIDAIDQTVILGLGETLNTVMGDDYLGGFFKKVQEVPEEAVQGAKNIAGVVAAWIGVSWLDFVANLATFGKSGTITFDFAALGTAIAGFCDSIKGLSEDDLKKAQIAAGIGVAMAEFSKNMPRHGWWEKITGKKTSIAEFGTEMEGFAAGVISMAHTAAQLTDEDVENINTLVTAVEPLNTLAQSLDNTGGLLAAIAGDDDLGTFGSTLIPFAEGLMQFCGKAALIKTLTPDFATDIADVATAVEPLNTLAQSLENTGGLLGRIVGNDDLATFGATLVPFADSLAAFITTVRENGLNDESLATDIQMIADATTPLAELADKLSDDEINFAGFGTLQLDEFGKDIKKYAKALKDASDSFEGASIFNLNRIAQTIEPVSALAELSTNEKFTKDNIKQIVDAVSEMAELDLEELSDAFDEDVTVVDSLKNLLDDMVVTLDEKKNESKTRFKNFALDDMIELALGIRSSINIHIIPAINDMVKAIFDKLDTVMDPTKFKIYGKNLSKGLSEGIEEGSEEAEESTTKLAKKVEKTLKDGLMEKSPSKLSRKFGIYWDKGLANGITYGTEEVVKTTEDLGDAVIKGLEVYNSKVYNAAESMGSSASETLNSGLSSSLQKIFGMDDDFNPVIRPRLDLTDVTNGARRIGSLLGNRSIGVNGDAQNGSTIGGNGTVVFNQYNNSPKALPRIDIYRNTSNLLAMARIKGALT